MIFDKEKNELVQRLKSLRSRKNQEPYKKLKETVRKKYGVSARAVEMWLNKRTPGLRKGRSDAGKVKNKITSKEKKLTKELIETGMMIKDIRAKVEEKTGKKISGRKLDRVRGTIEGERSEETGVRNEVTGVRSEEIEESNFGDAGKELFRKLFDMDLIPADRGIGITVGKKRFVIPKEDVEDICLILANAYNRQSDDKKLKVDRNELLKRKIFNLIEQQVRLASTDRIDTKSIEAITRMYDRMLVEVEMDANIKCVESICKELKPDISFTEVVMLIKKYSVDE